MTDPINKLSPLEERPLVTFALFAYNQEKYIREAVEGAFAQTYEPLEIILSDDCSTDRTFEIMQEMAAGYAGPHAIKLNRNIKNSGISPHVRFIDEMAAGEIIVHAAGDDVSLPERTTVLVNAFGGEKDLLYVCSNALKISTEGVPLGLVSKSTKKVVRDRSGSILTIGLPGINGCAVAIRKKLIHAFPSPDVRIVAEDIVLLRRASLIGDAKYIPDVLVKYRQGSGVTNSKHSLSDAANKFIKHKEDEVYRIRQLEKDIQYADHNCKSLIASELASYLARTVQAKRLVETKKMSARFSAVGALGPRETLRIAKYFYDRCF